MEKSFSYSGYVTGMGYDNPMLILFNDVGTTKQVVVSECKVREVSPTINNASAAAGKFVFKKITAASGGDSVQVVKADTLAPNLPSQIDIKINSDVTEVAASILGARIANPVQVSPFASRLTGGRLWLANLWSTQQGEGSTQHITLAAGEGFAVTNFDDKYSQSGTWQLVCTFKVGTDAFYINTEFYAREFPTAYFSFMNNTGSGISINIVSLEINEVGSSFITSPSIDAPYVGFKRIEGYGGGEVVTPLARDTSNVLPSTVTLRRNRLFHDLKMIDAGSKAGAPNKYGYGYPSTFMQQARSAGLFRERLLYVANRIDKTATARPASAFQANMTAFGNQQAQGNLEGIVLNQGEGVALSLMNFTHYASYYVELEFYVRESSVSRRPRPTLSI
jgi:hypothetical protein